MTPAAQGKDFFTPMEPSDLTSDDWISPLHGLEDELTRRTKPTLYVVGINPSASPAAGAVLVAEDEVLAEFSTCQPGDPTNVQEAMGLLIGAALDLCCLRIGGPMEIRYWTDGPIAAESFGLIAYIARNDEALKRRGKAEALPLGESPHLQRARKLAKSACLSAWGNYTHTDAHALAESRRRVELLDDVFLVMLEDGDVETADLLKGAVSREGGRHVLRFAYRRSLMALALEADGETFTLDVSGCENPEVAQEWTALFQSATDWGD